MKKIIIGALMLTLVISLFASDIMQKGDVKRAIETKHSGKLKIRNTATREGFVPTVEFDIDPIDIEDVSFYDYMPGGYNNIPMKVGTDGLVYMVYHRQDNLAATTHRKVSRIIIENGEVADDGWISSAEHRMGYATLVMDYTTGDAISVWHGDANGDERFNVEMTSEVGHVDLQGWMQPPFDVIDNTEPNQHIDYNSGAPGLAPENEYIWPHIFISWAPGHGEPSDDSWKSDHPRRVYVYANNTEKCPPGGEDDPASENVLFAWADITDDILTGDNALADADFHYQTIEYFDNMHVAEDNENWDRPFKSMTVSKYGGRVVFTGYNASDQFMVVWNDHFGEEGYWQVDTLGFEFDCENPLDSTEVPQPTFDSHDLKWSFTHCGHHNAILSSDNSKVFWMGAMSITGISDDNGDDSLIYYPWSTYPKMMSYDFNTGEFAFADIDEMGANPYDMEPMRPWDLDEDGVVDQCYSDSTVYWGGSWPIYFEDADAGFHTNSFKITRDHNWMVALWLDGYGAKNAASDQAVIAQRWIDYKARPEMCIAVSSDEGETWSETVRMHGVVSDSPFVEQNDFYTELEDQSIAFLYPADKIEVIDDYHGRVHIMYMDDNSFGPNVGEDDLSFGEQNGGQLKYAALNVQFEHARRATDAVNPNGTKGVSAYNLTNVSNSPNPFNPNTKISFSLANKSNVSLKVYNVKGELVKTLVNNKSYGSGNHDVIWNGTSNAQTNVASGVYFYKLESGNETKINKMLLLK